MVPVVLAALWLGGDWWIGLLTAGCAWAMVEWVGMVRGQTGWRWQMPLMAAGFGYISLTFPALVLLRANEKVGPANVMFVLLVVWGSDIGAYLLGRLVGGPKLAPRISPGKTRSGAVGGLLAAMLIGWGATLMWQTAPLIGVLVGAALSVASQIGDLLESAAKRRFGVKDSGRLIPGHGGVLDRVDGLLMAAPIAALLAVVLGQGKVLWQ